MQAIRFKSNTFAGFAMFNFEVCFTFFSKQNTPLKHSHAIMLGLLSFEESQKSRVNLKAIYAEHLIDDSVKKKSRLNKQINVNQILINKRYSRASG